MGWGVLWAEQNWPVADRMQAVRQRDAPSLGRVRGIDKLGYSSLQPHAGGYHKEGEWVDGAAGPRTPSPPGYLARKLFVFFCLQVVGVCKIFIIKGLLAKYSIERA
jgi:hypothetical protein